MPTPIQKETLQGLRRKAWNVLIKELDVIYIISIKNCSAKAKYNDTSITVWVDPMRARIDHAVVHEILHKLLDGYFRQFAKYSLFEFWITSLEGEFFKSLTHKEIAKWHKAIRAKTKYTN
jgi:hypothetical protein